MPQGQRDDDPGVEQAGHDLIDVQGHGGLDEVHTRGDAHALGGPAERREEREGDPKIEQAAPGPFRRGVADGDGPDHAQREAPPRPEADALLEEDEGQQRGDGGIKRRDGQDIRRARHGQSHEVAAQAERSAEQRPPDAGPPRLAAECPDHFPALALRAVDRQREARGAEVMEPGGEERREQPQRRAAERFFRQPLAEDQAVGAPDHAGHQGQRQPFLGVAQFFLFTQAGEVGHCRHPLGCGG